MQKFYDYNPDNPFDVSGESHKVSDKKVILQYTPLKGSVTIKSGNMTLTEAASKEDLKENEFYIDYSEQTKYRGATQEVTVNVPDDTEIVVDYKGVSTIIFAKHMNEIKEHMESSDNFESEQKALNETFAKKTDKIAAAVNADRANKLSTARNISLSGDVTGSASFDGSSDIKINATVTAYSNVLDTPEAHNCIIRGKDLTAQLNDGTLSNNIQNGTFHDIFVGDYFTKSYSANGVTYNVKWIIVDIDYFYASGDSATMAHHVVVMPDSCVQVNVNMNDTNTTSGGFINSKMWKTTIPAHVTGIVSAFGDAHVLQHRELLSNATSDTATSAAGAGWTGTSTGWGWYDVKVNIPSEPMIYGGTVFGSSGFDVGNKSRQLAYFRCKPFCMSRQWFWLQAVANSTTFCYAASSGCASAFAASYSVSNGGFLPYFLYH